MKDYYRGIYNFLQGVSWAEEEIRADRGSSIGEKKAVNIKMTLFDDEEILKAYTKDITHKEARETAERMIRKGKMPLEDIADYVPSISLDELRKLESEIMQTA